MAECTISRCSHERRVFRKELHKWSKEILYVLGLERLAEELMGARKWKILVQPFTDLDKDCSTDWYPEEICCFCCAKKQPPYDPASGIIPSVEGYNSLRIDTDEHSGSSDQANFSGSFNSCTSGLSPWNGPSSNGTTTSPPLLDQPLDLSINSTKQVSSDSHVKSRRSKQAEDNKSSSKSVIKVPQIPSKSGQRKRLETNSKRSYTEDELQAALRDIQSGKLGTRRAAVIYGIPRSTLRNKVYKLSNESKSRSHNKLPHTHENSVKAKEGLKNTKLNSIIETPLADNENNLINLSSASESLRQLLKHNISQKVLNSSKLDSKANSDSDTIISHGSEDDCMDDLQTYDHLDYSSTPTPILPHVFSNMHNLAVAKSNENIQSFKDDLTLPLLPNLIRRLAEERLEIEQTTPNESDMPESHSDPLLSNVILKVPSFKPAKSPSASNEADNPVTPSLSSPPGTSSHSGNKDVTITLKELISRSINQRVNSSCKNNEDDASMDYPFNLTSLSLPWSFENPKDMKDLSNVQRSNSPDSSKSEKRTRPKRGRYRNYDRDNLARAVRAVQKGEMSVHRAGTFYGVPHSTLEYKVKERHLLRPRKRDIFSSILLPDSTDPIAPSKSTSPESSVKNLQSISQSFSEPNNELDSEDLHRPTMGSSPLSLWRNMPFLSLDFSQLGSNNFFASQMMRKLQENALLHQETQKKKGEDLSFIESLIKSTLERSVSPESKSTLVVTADSVECKSNNVHEK